MTADPKPLLRRLYAPPEAQRASFAPVLEERVLSSYAARFGKRHVARPGFLRTGLAAAGVVALVGLACEIPTRSQVELGQHVGARFTLRAETTNDALLEAALRQDLAALGIERLSIGIAHEQPGEATLELVAWGDAVAPDALEHIVRRHLGAEQVQGLQVTALAGTVSETLGRQVGRRLFGRDLEQQTAEDLRLALLQRLAREDLIGTVQVQQDGTRRTITVEARSQDGSRREAEEIILESQEP